MGEGGERKGKEEKNGGGRKGVWRMVRGGRNRVALEGEVRFWVLGFGFWVDGSGF